MLAYLNKYIDDINSSIEESIMYTETDDDDYMNDDRASNVERDFWKSWNDGNLDMPGYGK